MKRIAMNATMTDETPQMTYADIGRRLNMSAGAVYWVEQRALRMIRDTLRNDIERTPALRDRFGHVVGGDQ